jgi:TolB protein
VTRRPGAVAWEPSFSPDGQWIVFESHPEANADDSGGSLWKVRLDGSGMTQLTDGAADDRQPNWSPAGDRIVFQSLERGNWDLFTIDSDGHARTRLTTSSGDDTDAAFSPDGLRVVYSTDAGLEVLGIDGGGPMPVDTGGGYAGAPAWSPDGGWIAFETTEAEDPDGSAGTRLAIAEAP